MKKSVTSVMKTAVGEKYDESIVYRSWQHRAKAFAEFSQLYGETMEVSAYRVKGLSRTFNDRLDIMEGISVEEKYNVTPYGSLQEALLIQPDIVFITNITSRHIECAIEAAKAGCHIFLEKPVSDSMKGIDLLRAEAEKNHVTVFVGYQYRYHICLLKLKNI